MSRRRGADRDARREADKRYSLTKKGKDRQKRYDINRTHRPPGPAGQAGPVGAAAQRERRARPEYVLARRLGISVKLARDIIESGGTDAQR